jgi:hypothetical protein
MKNILTHIFSVSRAIFRDQLTSLERHTEADEHEVFTVDPLYEELTAHRTDQISVSHHIKTRVVFSYSGFFFLTPYQ